MMLTELVSSSPPTLVWALRDGSYEPLPEAPALDLTTVYSNLVPREIFVASFVSENKKYHIDPPLKFLWDSDPETKIFEINGEKPYQDILVYGETIEVAMDVLQTEILPILWEEYVNGEETKLSPNAQKMKIDLKMRVVE